MTVFTGALLFFAVAQLEAPPADSPITLIRADLDRVDQPAPEPPVVLDVGSDKQLFADDWCIESSQKLKQTQHTVQKHPQNPLLRPEEPWEKPCVLISGSVFYDPERIDDRFRMWYLCFTPAYSADYGSVEKKDGRIAYATSRDGLHWVRPKLGIHEFQGSRDNNIVIPGPYGFPGVVLDPRDPDPKRRYKAHARTSRGHTVYFSEDGIHWSDPHHMNLDGYDRSSVHWDPLQQMWIGSTKSWYHHGADGPAWRGRGYQASHNYLEWPGRASFMTGTPLNGPDIVYALEPFFYESLFLGVWGRYTHNPHGLLDVQLAVSRNGRHWELPSTESWIPLSPLPDSFVPGKPSAASETGVDPFAPGVPWDYGNNNVNSIGPIRVGDELHIYYSGRTSDHRSSPQTGAIGLSTLRLDGFFSLDAGTETGTLITRPLRLRNGDLRLNANAKNGEIRVEVLDEQNLPIEPYTLANCEPIRGDDLRHVVSWNGNSDVTPLKDRTIRLRFSMKQTELYAFWTGEEHRWNTPDTSTWKPLLNGKQESPVQSETLSDTGPGRSIPIQQASPQLISSQPQLFLDDQLIARQVNLIRRPEVPEKHPGNPVLRRDKPWEKRLIEVYGTVLYDESADRFRCWYLANENSDGIPDNPEHPQTVEYYQCYAESSDGIQWTKPNVGTPPFGRHQTHNIVIPGGHGFCVLETADDPDPERRFRGAGGAQFGFSPDGIRWTLHSWRNEIGKNDTGTSLVRWKDEYLAFVRYQISDPSWPGVLRGVGLSSSRDFLHWTPKELVFQTDNEDGAPWTQPYGLSVTAYDDQLIGLLWLLHLDRKAGNNSLGDMDVQLIVSRDGRTWNRVADRSVFLKPTPGAWDSGRVFPGTTLVRHGDRILIYYTGTDTRHGEAWGNGTEERHFRDRSDPFAAIRFRISAGALYAFQVQ